MDSFVKFVVIVWAAAAALGLFILWDRKREKASAAAAPASDRLFRYAAACPRCGKENMIFAAQRPEEWQCGECACRYGAGGTICASSASEYARINSWDGLEMFIGTVLRATCREGFIRLDNGMAYLCRGREEELLTWYPTEGITRTGELHLMDLCMKRCEAHYREQKIGNYVSFWLMERGLAWKWEK